jgi:hypothetical protein
MLLAALAGVRARVNIPIAMAACWVSNPFTQAPIWLAQERLGDWIRSNSNHALLHMLDVEKTVFGVTLNMASFVVGFITLGIVLSIIAYPIVYGISAFLPHKGKRLTPSMRRSESPSSIKKSS